MCTATISLSWVKRNRDHFAINCWKLAFAQRLCGCVTISSGTFNSCYIGNWYSGTTQNKAKKNLEAHINLQGLLSHHIYNGPVIQSILCQNTALKTDRQTALVPCMFTTDFVKSCIVCCRKYWTDLQNLKSELNKWAKAHHGDMNTLPSNGQLRASGCSQLCNAIEYHGGFHTVATKLG